MVAIGYVRVSSEQQSKNYSLENQRDLLKKWGVREEDIFEEIASASTMDRPVLQQILKEILKPGDSLTVSTLDRFSRQILPTLFEINDLQKRNVTFFALDYPGNFDFNKPINVLITTVISFLAEQELANRKQRQMAGIAKAKNENKYRGRKTVIDKKLIKNVGHFYYECNLRGEALGKVCNVSRNTAFKALKLYNESKNCKSID